VVRRFMWSRNPKNVETMARVGMQRHMEKYIKYIAISPRVKARCRS